MHDLTAIGCNLPQAIADSGDEEGFGKDALHVLLQRLPVSHFHFVALSQAVGFQLPLQILQIPAHITNTVCACHNTSLCISQPQSVHMATTVCASHNNNLCTCQPQSVHLITTVRYNTTHCTAWQMVLQQQACTSCSAMAWALQDLMWGG